MINPFAQKTKTFKIFFQCLFKDISILEENFIDPNIENILSVATFEVTGKSIEPEDDDLWVVEIYLAEYPNLSSIKEILNIFCIDHNIKILSDVACEEIKDTDWVSEYAKQMQPIITKNFFISSINHRNLCPSNKQPVYIEAARAFGTGQHETTYGCIEALEYLSSIPLDFKNIIDIGTGTGILAICAAKIWPNAQIQACDIEKIAVNIAINNAVQNNVEIECYQNHEHKLFPNQESNKKFDLIISNILAKPLIALSTEMKKIARPGALIMLSGFLESQMSMVIESFEKIGFKYAISTLVNNWCILTLKY